MQLVALGKEDDMKKILIEKVSNGYLVTVSNEGVQSLFDSTKQYIAADVEEVLQIVKDNA